MVWDLHAQLPFRLHACLGALFPVLELLLQCSGRTCLCLGTCPASGHVAFRRYTFLIVSQQRVAVRRKLLLLRKYNNNLHDEQESPGMC